MELDGDGNGRVDLREKGFQDPNTRAIISRAPSMSVLTRGKFMGTVCILSQAQSRSNCEMSPSAARAWGWTTGRVPPARTKATTHLLLL